MRRAILSALVCALSAGPALAQCPDGSPPPCREGARRALPASAWIVVPFTNAMRAPDLDWLRDASINLLSLDLGRWTDITVVDDRRVADLLRARPASAAQAPLTLNDGLALARRAGAGRLVMGDYYKVGGGARLAANVFDVNTGRRLRSVTQEARSPDSLLTAFGPLARGVLDLPPPPDARLGAIGTTSVGAYQEYLLGQAALNRWETREARTHLVRALALDSSFALAHYKLSMAIALSDTASDTTEQVHAASAARLGGALPPRERALISARLASSSGDWTRACDILAPLVAHDSSDVEALFGLGDCHYHGVYLYAEPIDSVNGRLRGNWNAAIAEFRRVLLLDPSYHPAFEHILDALRTSQLAICRPPGETGCANDPVNTWVSYIVRDGDSLLIQLVRGTFVVKDPWRIRQSATRSARRNLEAAQRIAREWVEAGPAEARAHLDLGTIDLLLGQPQAADAELRQVPAGADPFVRRAALRHRVEAAILTGRAADARVLLDTLWRARPDVPARGYQLGPLYAALGQMGPMQRALDQRAANEHWTPEKTRYWHQAHRVMLGLPVDSLNRDERAYWESLPGDTTCAAGRANCRATLLAPTMYFAPTMPRAWWPYRGERVTGSRFFVSFYLARGDTAFIHERLAPFLDSLSLAQYTAGTDELGLSIHASQAWLALRDSARALASTRFFVDSVMPAINNTTTSNNDEDWNYFVIVRMMLQRADLAAALGHPDEARLWYDRVLDLWSAPDAELQPFVQHIRERRGQP